MSAQPFGNRNRATHRAVVELVEQYLDSEGIENTVSYAPARASDAVGHLDPDISISGVALSVTSRLRHRLNEDLDNAVRTAALSGAPTGALVQWREDRPIADTYVVLTLAGLARLVRDP